MPTGTRTVTAARGWYGLACWNALSHEQQRLLIEVGVLPIKGRSASRAAHPPPSLHTGTPFGGSAAQATAVRPLWGPRSWSSASRSAGKSLRRAAVRLPAPSASVPKPATAGSAGSTCRSWHSNPLKSRTTVEFQDGDDNVCAVPDILGKAAGAAKASKAAVTRKVN